MNNQQKHAPKYWVLHNIEEDDVIIQSASKCHSSVISFAEELYGEDWFLDERFEVCLIELVKLKSEI
jgi:hypothetical protein